MPVRIVLVEARHPGNIGSTARAMKNMGLTDLVLVAPRCYPDPEATALAVNAADVLEAARVVPTLTQAVADCAYVYGTAADVRDQAWPIDTAAGMAQKIAQMPAQQIAVVFGRENTGLNNEELKCCHAQIQIPTHNAYNSLNLAQAVQVISYEIFKASEQSAPPNSVLPKLADQGKRVRLYEAFKEAAEKVGYLDPERPLNFAVRMQQIIQQMPLLDKDANLLLGFLKRVK